MTRDTHTRHVLFLLFAVALLAGMVPLALAMVPGPTQEDDVPPLPEPEPVFTPEQEVTLPETVRLADYAGFPQRAYAGAMSIGLANRGALQGGVLFPRKSPFFTATRSDRQWATPETVDALLYAAKKVHERFGPTHKMVLGDLSYPQGGKLKTHRSHQSGRDADVGFFFRSGNPGFFSKGLGADFDVKRNWYFLEALVETNAIEYVFVDYQIQAALYNFVKKNLPYPQAYLDRVFQYPRGRRERNGIIRHARGHANHFHIRFLSPIAVANARNGAFDDPHLATLQDAMKGRATAGAATYAAVHESAARRAQDAYHGTTGRAVVYTVRTGDTLWSIAQRHNATVSQVRAWNDLSAKARLRIGQHLTIYRQSARNAAASQ
jgi:murein endopeptidase